MTVAGVNGAEPTKRRRIVAVVLAAGASTRMGAQKLLFPLSGTALVRRVVERVLATDVDLVTVVIGNDASRIREALSGLRCGFVENQNYREGIGTSFRAAVASFDQDVGAALFALADMPFVTTAMLQALLAAFCGKRPLAAISRFSGVIAPPHVFARELFVRLGEPGSQGLAKALLREHAERCVVVDLPEVGLTDVDDPQGYERAVNLASTET